MALESAPSPIPNSANRYGIVSSSERSSVRTLPSTRSRRLRASSSTMISKYEFSRSITGKYADAFPCETEKVSSTIPARLVLRLELEKQARLAGARLGHRGDNLSAARVRKLGGVAHRFHLALAADELRQAAPGRALQARAQRPESRDLVDVDRLGDAFDARGAARLECEVSFDQPARIFGDRNRAGRRDGLHPRGEIGRVPDWRVFDIAGAG